MYIDLALLDVNYFYIPVMKLSMKSTATFFLGGESIETAQDK